MPSSLTGYRVVPLPGANDEIRLPLDPNLDNSPRTIAHVVSRSVANPILGVELLLDCGEAPFEVIGYKPTLNAAWGHWIASPETRHWA